ncbi:MAG: glucose-inhibited division protein [Paenibacillaceae bacterium]|nr:glucose-inhibited division protein [Paenibacillaceae bacterium]
MSSYIEEKARSIPVAGQYDVIVCGGGPAGVAAAVAAARGGARTCLMEWHGCLGGIWTAGALAYIIDGANKTGLLPELLARLDEHQARTGFVCDVETTKLVLEQMCEEAGVAVRLHTRIASALTGADGRLAAIVTESKSGREAWRAELFIDATGDGDLAAYAGCGFDIGEEHTGRTQPMSLIALVAGPDNERIPHFTKPESQSRANLLAELHRAGFNPSYHRPALWHIRDGLYIMMANHQYGVSGLNADDITAATLAARKELHEMIRALRSLGGVWAELRLVGTGEQIGVREGRRIHGRYTVSIEDIVAGVRHEDGICRVSFKVDVHALDGAKTKVFEGYNDKYVNMAIPYDIPLRALIAKDVDGLLLAGRCISGDFLAHSSYRVTGNAVQIGQAAGVLAAAAIRQGVRPQDVAWENVSAQLAYEPIG